MDFSGIGFEDLDQAAKVGCLNVMEAAVPMRRLQLGVGLLGGRERVQGLLVGLAGSLQLGSLGTGDMSTTVRRAGDSGR